MEPIHCDVIGCAAPADWMLVAPDDIRCEEFLCDSHWAVLCVCKPHVVHHYVNISSVVIEETAADLHPAGP